MHHAIGDVRWPADAPDFALNPTRKGNGVKAIKEAAMLRLESYGWKVETNWDVGTMRRPGKLDAKHVSSGNFYAFEWETGNISSSHRALNKMFLACCTGRAIGGFLVVPSRAMYQYLTDRVGNFDELEPYFPLWEHLGDLHGAVEIIVIEHDRLDEGVPKLIKGTDGRALL